MIKHVVMWTLKDSAEGGTRAENVQRMKEKLAVLPKAIAEIRALEVGVAYAPGAGSYDVVLVSEFESRAALEAYQVHPAHQAVAAFVKAVTSGRAVVDYEC